jgi:hypothetical protein
MDDVEYSRINDSVIEKIVEWLEDNGIHKGSYIEISSGNTDGYCIDLDEMIIQVTQNDGKREPYYIGFFWEDNVELAESSLEGLRQYFARNTNFTPFPKFNISDLGLDLKDIEDTKVQSKYEDDLKDFIYKVDDTDTLKVQSNYESVESFFADKSDASYSDNESIVILAVDTKLPIIKLEKQLINNEKAFKFIVDIKTKDEDQFMIKTTIDSKEKFVSLLESTINSLKEFELFYKYADDLEKCL